MVTLEFSYRSSLYLDYCSGGVVVGLLMCNGATKTGFHLINDLKKHIWAVPVTLSNNIPQGRGGHRRAAGPSRVKSRAPELLSRIRSRAVFL